MDKFQNIYRIESVRLKGWDYGRNARYYVTICTGGRNCFFGEIVNGKINYSPAGDIGTFCKVGGANNSDFDENRLQGCKFEAFKILMKSG